MCSLATSSNIRGTSLLKRLAASWMQYVTAWGALIEQAKLTAGDFVIVTAASSSVGIAAFQIAKAVGATSLRLLGRGPRGNHSLSTEQIMLL